MNDLIEVLNESEIPNPLRHDIYRKMIGSLEEEGKNQIDMKGLPSGKYIIDAGGPRKEFYWSENTGLKEE